MAEHYLSLPGGLTACFRTACAVDHNVRLQLGAYVPGLSFLDEAPAHADITIDHAFSAMPHMTCHGTYITLRTADRNEFPDDLYHLIYSIGRRELFRRELYTVHAACVGKNDDYRLLAGHSGAGKTTLAQNLIDRHGLKLFSGNKTVVCFNAEGGITAIAGTRTMTALDSQQKRFAYELTSSDYARGSEVEIKSIALVRVNDGVEESQILSPASALHTLYPYFMDAVNADVIVNGHEVFDSAPSAQEKATLAEGLRSALKKIIVYKHSGSISFLQQKTLHP